MHPLSFVTWKWRAPDGSKRKFLSEHVNVLRAMLARHCRVPHQLVCITDDTAGLDRRIVVREAPDTGLEHLLSPMLPRSNSPSAVAARARARRQRRRMKAAERTWRHKPIVKRPPPEQIKEPRRLPEDVPTRSELVHFPACYRRLWLFSEQAAELGEWLFLLDIDCIIVRNVVPLLRFDHDFTGWADPQKFGPRKIAGGAWLLRAGSHPEVWTDFDPATSPAEAKEAGCSGSDQAWLSYKLLPCASTWSRADGMYKINWTGPGALPRAARILFTAGNRPPWSNEAKMRWPAAAKHWRV